MDLSFTSDPKLRYGFGSTYLGLMLVAQSEAGVAAVLLGDDQARLRRGLARAFPDCDALEDQEHVGDAIRLISASIADPGLETDLPLDIRGSALERAVWEALRAIPVGQTRTYGEIAHGLPTAATAQEVGAACAANRLAVVVPCHRVVKADGSISGYRWGVNRKRRLLDLERAA